MTDSDPAAPLHGDLAPALPAARRAAGSQHYPVGCLYVVATPIGNLADITLRALYVLDLADAIACEDTRHTARLLAAYGLGRKPLLALHQHNEAQAAQEVLRRLRAGERVACVSDAGTPAVSDPGARLVATCHVANLRVVPLPGASSVTSVLSAAGVVDAHGFVFQGFLPTGAGERTQAVAELAREPRAVVLLEAPHRMRKLAAQLADLGERWVTVGRELTKHFEEIATVACADLAAWLQADAMRQRGEFVLVLHPAPVHDEGESGRVLQLLLAELPLKQAVALAAQITGAPRNALYDAALALQREDGGEA